MPEIPADILAQLSAAEEALTDALQKDVGVKGARAAAEAAEGNLALQTQLALESHQDASKKAGDAIAALRAHFGV